MTDVSPEQASADAAHEDEALQQAIETCAKIKSMRGVVLMDEFVGMMPSFPELKSLCDLDADRAIDAVIDLWLLHKWAKTFTTAVNDRLDALSAEITDYFVETDKQSVQQSGHLVFLKMDRWPKPAIADILPPGVDPKDPQYKTTVEQAREAAKHRLLAALKDSELSDIVVENYNAQTLRSRLCGDEPAAVDELGAPRCPDSLMKRDVNGEPVLDEDGNMIPLVEITERPNISIRKATKK